MSSSAHKYFCVRCQLYIYGETLASLAKQVNLHASVFHPQDFSHWDEKGIVLSEQYTCTAAPLPQYLVPHGTTSKRISEITDEDRAMLKAGHVAWD
jgi:hypothetical protein